MKPTQILGSCDLPTPVSLPVGPFDLPSSVSCRLNKLPLPVTWTCSLRARNFDQAISPRSRCINCCVDEKKVIIRDEAAPSVCSGSYIGTELEAIYATCTVWQWKGYKINYAVQGTGSPLLLVHGFGASLGHWRRNIKVLAERYTVYAIDLLGFGASDKSTKFTYTVEGWAELLLDFSRDVIQAPVVLIGNSVGSLACLIANAEAPHGLIRGTVLLNCAGGMNNKAIVDDWRIKLVTPLLWLIDFLLNQRKIASALFERLKSRENLRNVLLSVYSNKTSVDDELVEVIKTPANDPGALDVFVSVVTGPPGPTPISLMPKISTPVLVLWGDEDPFTPLDGPIGKYFISLPSQLPNVELFVLQGVGHCPQDDRPDLVHEKLLAWLAKLPGPLPAAYII